MWYLDFISSMSVAGIWTITSKKQKKRKKYNLGEGLFVKEIMIVKKGKNGLPVKSAFSHVSFIQIRLYKSHDRVRE